MGYVFAVALHLTQLQLSAGVGSSSLDLLPSILPPVLIPPSLRPIPPDPNCFEESNRLASEIEAILR
ncbi:unnamed protein product [Protopolystoma xenopodis]|uniref:Uncharacterized protein n=1 Tax=Protopolystoma xenopodis TaxID=117903 RepID=A0A448WCJ5_9PLAT|nr:unnamed protein product [Protopolystoma xenopodis]